ncbi:hypothetical protein A3711_02850 [Erythrobacter sp. HI00D59]|nr:hypothetical protein A3711_02850 [Erythrobacter sp. HI00D59]
MDDVGADPVQQSLNRGLVGSAAPIEDMPHQSRDGISLSAIPREIQVARGDAMHMHASANLWCAAPATPSFSKANHMNLVACRYQCLGQNG